MTTPSRLRQRTATRLALRAARTPPIAWLVDRLDALDRTAEAVLPVLMYHRVGVAQATPQLDPSLLSATPAEFERQVAYLAQRRRVLSLDELLAVRRGQMELPRRAAVVTFDDGYRDFREHAWPTLRRHGVPAIVFIPTAYPDDPERSFWWDRLHAAFCTSERLEPVQTPAGTLPLGSAEERQAAIRIVREWVKRTAHEEAMAEVDRITAEVGGGSAHPNHVLSWAEIRALAHDGVDFCPHTHTHALLDRVGLEQAKTEILRSAAEMERRLGHPARAIAFPSGAFTDDVVSWLPEAGFELAFTTIRGGNHLDRIDWLRIRRINVGRHSALPLVQAQMLSWPTRLRR